MRTYEKTVYNFSELSNEAKEKAIKYFQKNQYEDLFLDFFVEDCIEKANDKGFNDVKIQYSLGYSQGDGLSFSAHLDISKLLNDFKPTLKTSVSDAIYNNISANCEANNGHYCYASKGDVSIEFENYAREYENLNELTNEFQEYVREIYLELCNDFEKNGYAEIGYQTSEEYAIEHFNNNNTEFDEDGNLE